MDDAKPRILYMEGEPRWDYKFLRRAVEDDKNIELYSIVRTTQNKIYAQVPADSNAEFLKAGFPTKVDDLFGFQGIDPGQRGSELFHRRPAGSDPAVRRSPRRRDCCSWAAATSLADGGYEKPPFADLLPVRLPDHKNTFHRDPATAGTDARRPRQPDHAHRRESRRERGALEEAAVPDEFSGSRASPSRARWCWPT